MRTFIVISAIFTGYMMLSIFITAYRVDDLNHRLERVEARCR